MSVVRSSRDQDVAVIMIDNPPVNALSQAVRQGIRDSVEAALSDSAVTAIVIAAAGRTFIAGADIREFGKPSQPPSLRDVGEALEGSAKPIVAALHGTSLGGGLEVALCCHYRIAAPGTKFGLPEVKLGILPGGGGTQRLPRLIGAKPALDMILSGDPIDVDAARRLGLVDAVATDDLVADAIAAARALGNKAVQVPDRTAEVPEGIFDEARKRLQKTARNLIAPFRIVDCIEAACSLPFKEGMEFERKALTECMESPQRAAQVHMFFAERAFAKIPEIEGVKPGRIGSAAILGAGTMGGGIAMCFANAGIPVHVVDSAAAAVERGQEVIRNNYAVSVKRGSMSAEDAEAALALISFGQDMAAGSNADIVIEAVFEDMAIKKEVMARLDAVMKPGAILATNTSTLDIDALADATSRPELVIGTHFFSPANVMKLLEVVRGSKASPQTIATTMGLGRTLGKITVLAGNCDGFIANRMHMPLGNEVDRLIEEGATPDQIDRVMRDFGLPMGPVAVRDLVGIDTAFRLRDQRRRLHPGKQPPTPLIDKLFEIGRLGQKVGKGYYRYEDRKAVPDPEVDMIIEDIARERGVTRRPVDDVEVRDRLLFALINEASRILDEGIALRVSDVDLAYVHGYGFPAWRGGPMFWASSLGLDKVAGRIRQFQQRLGDGWALSPYLEKAAADGSWPQG